MKQREGQRTRQSRTENETERRTAIKVSIRTEFDIEVYFRESSSAAEFCSFARSR